MTQEEAEKMHGYTIGYIARCNKVEKDQRQRFRTDFKINLKNAMKKRKISQKELSEITGFTQATISRYIKGDRLPSGYAVVLLSDVLDVTTDYLLKGI